MVMLLVARRWEADHGGAGRGVHPSV